MFALSRDNILPHLVKELLETWGVLLYYIDIYVAAFSAAPEMEYKGYEQYERDTASHARGRTGYLRR